MAAICGNSSPMRTPVTRVGMLANGPRKSAGAFGLGSQVSSCAGPPHSHSRMTERAEPLGPVPVAPKRSKSASDRPNTALALTCTNARRVGCLTGPSDKDGDRIGNGLRTKNDLVGQVHHLIISLTTTP